MPARPWKSERKEQSQALFLLIPKVTKTCPPNAPQRNRERMPTYSHSRTRPPTARVGTGTPLGHSDRGVLPLPSTSGRRTRLPGPIKSAVGSGLETFCELAEWAHRRPPRGFSPRASALALSQPAGPGSSGRPMARAERGDSSPYLGRAASPLRRRAESQLQPQAERRRA